MSNIDFQSMTQQQLRQYILAHRNDEDAVHEAVLRIQQYGREASTDEFIQVVKERLNNS